jgi:hypothetical protein
VAAGLVALPAERSYDRTESPAVPMFVTLPRAVEPEQRSSLEVWHPELAWAADARLTSAQRELLAKINQWLFRGRHDLVVPLRERSLEIFGEEKLLDSALATSLFAQGRLSLELLATRRVAPRLSTERVGDGDVLMVVENSDTFDSLVRVLAQAPGRVGLVGWGAGSGFEASVLSVASLAHQVREIRYFGDLDRNGLRIPASASRLAVLSGLPPVRPAVALYDALLRVGAPQSGQPKQTSDAATALVEWLDPTHRVAAHALLVNGSRLAQEAVGLTYLLGHHDWR